MKEVMLACGALRLAEVNGRGKVGKSVLVITDCNTTTLAERVARAAASLGGDVVTLIMPREKFTAKSRPRPSPPRYVRRPDFHSGFDLHHAHTRRERRARLWGPDSGHERLVG